MSSIAKSIMVFLFSFMLFAPARAKTETDNIKEPDIIFADPALAPELGKPIAISDNMDVNEQIAVLVMEIERLKAQVARVTIIVTVDLQMANTIERDGVEVTLSGGKLGKPVSCITNQIGQCIFVTNPLAAGDPDYKLKISRKFYKDTEKKLRLKPGAIVLLTIKVDLTDEELDRRINPPIPTK